MSTLTGEGCDKPHGGMTELLHAVVLIMLPPVCIGLYGWGRAPCKDEQLADWSVHSCDTAISSQIIPPLHWLGQHGQGLDM